MSDIKKKGLCATFTLRDYNLAFFYYEMAKSIILALEGMPSDSSNRLPLESRLTYYCSSLSAIYRKYNIGD